MRKIFTILAAVSISAAAYGQKKPAAAPATPAAAAPAAQPAGAAPATVGSSSTASEKYSKLAIGAELLGAGILWSGMVSYRPFDIVAVNLQGSYYSGSASASSGSTTVSANFSIFMIPVTASLLLGGQNHKFEALGGAIIAIVSGTVSGSGASGAFSGNGAVPIIGAGYRYQPHDGGFFFRATGYYIIATSGGSSAGWVGLTLGYAFSG